MQQPVEQAWRDNKEPLVIVTHDDVFVLGNKLWPGEPGRAHS